jgi:hypothetical protein
MLKTIRGLAFQKLNPLLFSYRILSVFTILSGDINTIQNHIKFGTSV